MIDLAATLFARYNFVMRTTLVGVMMLAGALVYMQYRDALAAQTAELSLDLREQAAALDAVIKTGSDAVNTMRLQGENWYRLHPEGEGASSLRRALLPCPNQGRICLDHLPQPWTTAQVGNLTGFVDAPDAELGKELEMALSLNGTFQSIEANLPAAAWLYYMSVRHFINLYPWVSSQEYFFSDSALKKPFFADVGPDRNPGKAIVWTAAYLDAAGKGKMVTVSAPVYSDGVFRGAVALDLTLKWLDAFVSGWGEKYGTLFIINNHNQLIAHPTIVRSSGHVVLSAAAAFPPALADMDATLAAASASDGGLVLRHGYYVGTLGIEHGPFRLVLLVPRSQLVFAALRTGVPAVLLLVFGLTLMLLIARRFASRDVIVPAEKLVRYIQEAERGLSVAMPDVPLAWRPWFQSIRNVFDGHAKLVGIQQELDVAMRMQQSIVPARFPLRKDLQMAARMIPAKEVGGDFYDYFWLSETRLGVVIADVSGKGVPAALFMAVARTLLRAIAPGTRGPGACLELANDMLSEDNDEMMFVTLFYGILDIESGEFEYANGGHNPPYVIEPDGTVVALPGTGGMALGVMAGMQFREGRRRLEKGSTVLLFTDGMTEAFDRDDRAYGEQRLERQLAGRAGEPVAALLDQIVGDVHAFTDGAPQSDDITCFALHIGAVSPEGAWTDEFYAELDPRNPDVDGLFDRLQMFFEGHSLSQQLLQSFSLAIDELVVNVVSYGAARRPIQVRLGVSGSEVRAQMIDDGVAFDPLRRPDPDVNEGVETRLIGGLGIFLVRRLMDHVSYERVGCHNYLHFSKQISPAA